MVKRNKIEDPEYLDWIRTLPCCHCSDLPIGKNQYGNEYHCAVHHIKGRDNDHLVVPVCDRTVSGPGCRDCHHLVYHTNIRKHRPFLTRIAEEYYKRYKKEV